MERHYDLVIIGAGPAGMTASIYASRAGLKTAMIEMGAPGGKLIKTAEISNWPGVKTSHGAKLAYQMFEHSTMFGADYLYGNVVEIQVEDNLKKVICEDQTIYFCKAVIVATGTQERMMNIKNEKECIGKGVSYCAVCDGAFFKDREVVVVGGGNSALEESLYLTQFAKKVTIIIRRDVFRADEIVQKHVLENNKIEIIKNHVPIEVCADENKVTGLCIEDKITKNQRVISCDGIFPYIGLDPATKFLKNFDVLDDYGYIKVDHNCQTKIPGIYGAGDVIVKNLRQVVTATNDGAIAAQHAFHSIKKL